ncbi:MAG TPA: GNAT family N-acetyltransferase [Solirubrobacteraceae bacterium]|nr:GNAT family N-acetyltransferase [Solirubrobacteraceae bacterium]
MSSGALVRDVLLRDGSTLRLRAPTHEDLDDIKAFYDEGLSDESRYMRFHGYLRTEVAARAYAEANGVDRVALIGRQGDHIVAAASYDLLREPGTAEVAFAVADDFQGRGTATRMLEQLASIAAERGVRRFDAEVLGTNRPMLLVFERAGFEIRRKGTFGELTVSLDITPSEAVRERIDARDHVAAIASLRPILSPRAIAVVGASSAPGDLGAAVLKDILDGGFRGVVSPVNRSGEVVSSMRCARSLIDLDDPPELVIAAVDWDELADVAAQASAIGAKALLVLTSDPDLEPEEVQARRDELLEIVRTGGLRLVGPGSLGVLNTDPAVSLNATFAGASVPAGRLAICSQSGAIGIGLLGHAAARQLGISGFASIGDRVDVSTNDLLELWEEDERTAAVMLYVETFGNPEHFTRIAQRVSRRKPILAVKGRRAHEGVQLETRSHTAAALRGDAVVDALFRQAGVLRFQSGDELFSAAAFFESQPLPLGRRVAVISNSTGVATLAVDACATRRLALATGVNPVLLPARAGRDDYLAAVRGALTDEGVDAIAVYYVDLFGGDSDAVLSAVARACGQAPKPVVASILGADGGLPPGDSGGVPNFLFPETCAAVLARGVERREWLSRPLGQRAVIEDHDPRWVRTMIGETLAHRDASWLTIEQSQAMLDGYRIARVASALCDDLEHAVAAAAAVDGPIALKAAFPPPAHAADIDAVLLGLEGEAAVRAGWRELERRVELAERRFNGAIVQPLLGPGADVLIGAMSDPDFGPVMALGLGGRQAGLAGTAAFRVLPGTDVEADELIDASESVVAQLEGFRDAAKLDRAALRGLLLRFALLLRDLPEVVEADLNPVRCMAEGCTVLDSRIRVERRLAPVRVKTW